MKKSVSKIARLGLLVALAILLASPIYECFDHWDHPAGGGDDTVLTLVGTLTLAGLALVLRLAIPQIFASLRRIVTEIQCESGEQAIHCFLWICCSPRSPPIEMSSPLRI
jgi:hypothetical protein